MTGDFNAPDVDALPVPSASAPLDATTVWHAFQDPLSAFIRARMPSTSDADDVLQQVFTRIQRSAAGGAEVRHVSGWVHTIARNAIADFYRSTSADASRNEKVRLQADMDASAARFESSDDDDAASAELSQCVRPFLARLPAEQREALELTDLGSLSQTAAAKQLSLSTSTMKSRVQRGRSNLRNLIASCCSVELDSRRKVVDFEQRAPAAACGCGANAHDDTRSH